MYISFETTLTIFFFAILPAHAVKGKSRDGNSKKILKIDSIRQMILCINNNKIITSEQ